MPTAKKKYEPQKAPILGGPRKIGVYAKKYELCIFHRNRLPREKSPLTANFMPPTTAPQHNCWVPQQLNLLIDENHPKIPGAAIE